VLGILFGLFILYAGYGMLASQTKLMEYKKSFSQVQHPQGTSLLDSQAMQVAYYPATYADDSIHFKSAYVVGELRRFTGNWDDIKTFYDGKRLEEDMPVIVIPVELRQHGQQTSLSIANGYVSSPFDYDVLSEMQDDYSFWGIPQSLNETEQNLYLVYSAFFPLGKYDWLGCVDA
jgi:hypothetical protein